MSHSTEEKVSLFIRAGSIIDLVGRQVDTFEEFLQ